MRVPGAWPAAKAVRLRRSTTHSPASIRAAQLGGVRDRRQGEVGLGRPGGVGRRHVGVVRRPGAEPGEQLVDVGLLVLGEDGVGPLLPADGRGGRVGLGGGAERAEAVGRVDLGVVGQELGEPVRRRVLVVHEVVGVLGAEQVGPAGGAVEQRAAGEDGDLLGA